MVYAYAAYTCSYRSLLMASFCQISRLLHPQGRIQWRFSMHLSKTTFKSLLHTLQLEVSWPRLNKISRKSTIFYFSVTRVQLLITPFGASVTRVLACM